MLQSLDTLIAFVVIMTITSLFVTIIVQMFSAALSLRGKNLANALALTFQTIDPSLAGAAHQLAARILTDPLLSDSTRTVKNKTNDPGDVAYRTKPWHFANPFGASRLANAVRSDEVFAALKKLAKDAGVASPSSSASGAPPAANRAILAQAAGKIINALPTSQDKADALKTQFAGVFQILSSLPDDPIKQKLLAAVNQTSTALIKSIEPVCEKFEELFSSAQDRAQQWFQLHARGLTIGASIVIALICQLDAVEVFHYVSTNSAGRTALVASANSVINEGDGTLDEKGGLIKRVADAWNTNYSGLSVGRLTGIIHTGQLEEAIERVYQEKGDNTTFKTKGELDDAYNKLVAATTQLYYRNQGQKLADLTRGVGVTGFDLVPTGIWRWPSVDKADAPWQSFCNIGHHLLGIFLFAALLTLGAPYWYNLLKNLASLRPALSQLIGKETTDQAQSK